MKKINDDDDDDDYDNGHDVNEDDDDVNEDDDDNDDDEEDNDDNDNDNTDDDNTENYNNNDDEHVNCIYLQNVTLSKASAVIRLCVLTFATCTKGMTFFMYFCSSGLPLSSVEMTLLSGKPLLAWKKRKDKENNLECCS